MIRSGPCLLMWVSISGSRPVSMAAIAITPSRVSAGVARAARSEKVAKPGVCREKVAMRPTVPGAIRLLRSVTEQR